MQLLMIVLALFGPAPAYCIKDPVALPLESQEFARLLANICDAETHCETRLEVLTNGGAFYESELAAIRSAASHICLEAYIFQKGEIAGRFIEALVERARAGVKVRIVLDAIGSFNTWPRDFRELTEVGGEVCWYMPLRWYNLPRYNNRTHRELLVVDGKVGYIGGAGVADHWYKSRRRHRQWRDTMVRVEGRAVAGLQSLFLENWLESSGELLVSPRFYPGYSAPGNSTVMVINSSPSVGRSTPARMLFQTLIASAARTIHLTTPYFLPDRSARREMVRAMQRGVELKIIVPGKHSDHLLTRRSSRRLYGDLLKNGAEIFEYQPSMIHTKSLVVDSLWSVVGSTNFDSRSFGLNDEMNMAVQCEEMAARMELDFQEDVAKSRRVSYREWRRRSPFERIHEWLGWILERQE